MQELISNELGINTPEDLQELKDISLGMLAILENAKQGNTPMTDDEYFIPVGVIAHTIKISKLVEEGKQEEALDVMDILEEQVDKNV